MAKYIVNKTNIAYQFQNGLVLGRKGSIEVNDKQEAELAKDYFFNGLKSRGAIAISSEKPKDLSEAGMKIAAKEAEVKELQKKIKELEEKLDAAAATGKETSKVIDSAEPQSAGNEPNPENDETKPEDNAEATAEAQSNGKGKKGK